MNDHATRLYRWMVGQGCTATVAYDAASATYRLAIHLERVRQTLGFSEWARTHRPPTTTEDK